MKVMKFTLKTVFISAIFAAALIGTAIDATAKELRLSAAPPLKSPWGAVAKNFADKVAEISNGKLTIALFLGSKLGGEQQVVRQIARGRIDMGVISNTGVSLLVPEFGLLASPYAFRDPEQADCVADNHLLDTFGEDFDKAGVMALSWMEVGHQALFTKTPVRSPSDLSGLKVRTAPTKADSLYIQTAGGTAVPLSPKDTLPALKTDNVHAATQVLVFGLAVGYPKVANQITVTNHVHQIGSILFSKQTWNGLTDEEKGWLKEAAPIFLALRKIIRGAEVKMLEKAVSEGATAIYPNAKEMAAWKAAAPEAQTQILKELGEKAAKVWSQIEKAKGSCT